MQEKRSTEEDEIMTTFLMDRPAGPHGFRNERARHQSHKEQVPGAATVSTT